MEAASKITYGDVTTRKLAEFQVRIHEYTCTRMFFAIFPDSTPTATSRPPERNASVRGLLYIIDFSLILSKAKTRRSSRENIFLRVLCLSFESPCFPVVAASRSQNRTVKSEEQVTNVPLGNDLKESKSDPSMDWKRATLTWSTIDQVSHPWFSSRSI
jgi:hypothetical protein